jgi:hypothetical protein
MKSLLLPTSLLVGLIAAGLIWFGGVRIIVIQPMGALPQGVTAVVAGLSDVNLLDSPDAICNRHEGGVSLLCRGREAATIAKHGKILVRLPYSETLFRLTGAPSVVR